MRRIAEGIWLESEPVSIVGTKLTTNMVVLRLEDGLLLYSPVPMTAERRNAVEALGVVRHLYAPNLFHHMFVGEWANAFPGAQLHAPAGLSKKRPDLRVDRLHGEGRPFGDLVDEVPIRGCRLAETALLYKPSSSVLVADLVHNVGRPEGWWTETYTKMAGFYDQVALSRVLRWTLFSDRVAARADIDALLSRPFDRVVVGHGEPIETDARRAFEGAYDWMAR